MEILRVESLCKKYGNKKVLTDLSFVLKKGHILGLLGPNGSGKTTTLGILLGVTSPSSGTFVWFNDPKKNYRLSTGAILEKPNFAPWMSGKMNLFVCASIKQITNKKLEVSRVLEKVGLEQVQSDYYATYSLGMKQRLALAAAMLGNPEVLVLDEPTNGLDPEGIAQIRSIIVKLANHGKTVILASHMLDEVEKICSHVTILKKGQMLYSGSLEEAVAFPNSIEVGSDDEVFLEGCLQSYEHVQSIDKMRGFFCVRLKPEVAPKDLHRHLIAKGIVVDHFCKRRGDLESYFLQAVEKNQ